ncbi:thiolase family protein [Nocardia xishanensis]
MDAVIVGTAMSQFGMSVDTPLRALAADVADQALADSGFEPHEVGLVVFANGAAGVITGQEMIRAHTSLGASRLAGRPMLSVENACASSSSALHLACLAVESGTHDVVVVVAAEKMTSQDRSLAGRALATAVDVHTSPYATPAPDGAPRPVFMEIYAANARAYLRRSDATVDDFAAVAAKATRNGSLNPRAQITTALTVEQVLDARVIADPLTRPMCSSISDGAAAVVVCNPRVAASRNISGVRVLASVIGAGTVDGPDDLVERTAARAYQQAGVGPQDLDVIELHDAAAPAELIVLEELGLAPPGEAAKLLRSGATDLGGQYPVNPSGGLIARGHPIGATGLAQVVELADQLRNRAGSRQAVDPRIALAENAGGDLGNKPAACVITILGQA